jgi:FkbM family methyltransferase
MLHSVGLDLVRYVAEFERPFDIVTLVVEKYLEIQKPFFFVQIGANDGIQDDPLRKLILGHKLCGLLVEPIPDIFEILRQNYADAPQLQFANVAISTTGGPLTMYRARNGVSLPKFVHGLGSFEKCHLEKQGVPKHSIEEISVSSVTLPTLLTSHGIREVTLLQVDTEGYDSVIVESALESGIFPEIINYEHCHLVPSTRLRCKRLLDKYDYRFVEAGKDTLAVRKFAVEKSNHESLVVFGSEG